MRWPTYLVIALIVPLAGCTLGASKQQVVPPPPQPAAVQPPAPEAPLSIPQTAVTLPSPQLVNPDAIPKVQTAQAPAPDKTEVPTVSRPVRRASTAKAEPEPEPETPAAPPAVAEQEHFQAILDGGEQKRIEDTIITRKREIQDKLGRGAKRRLSSHDRSLVDRINSFLTQCAQAAARGDYSQADSLSERALVLARELQGE